MPMASKHTDRPYLVGFYSEVRGKQEVALPISSALAVSRKVSLILASLSSSVIKAASKRRQFIHIPIASVYNIRQ